MEKAVLSDNLSALEMAMSWGYHSDVHSDEMLEVLKVQSLGFQSGCS